MLKKLERLIIGGRLYDMLSLENNMNRLTVKLSPINEEYFLGSSDKGVLAITEDTVKEMFSMVNTNASNKDRNDFRVIR